MSIIAKEGESNFTPVPTGMHLARCYRIVDLGTQKSEYQGQIKYLRKIMIQFEVHGEDDDGKPIVTNKNEPMSISKNFTLSLAEKATLRKDLSAWRGRDFTEEERKGFELKNVLGVWAMITVARDAGSNGKEYTNIKNINPVPKTIRSAGLPEGHNKVAMFSIDNPDMQLFDTFSQFLQEKIKSSPEWQGKDSGGKAKSHQSEKPADAFADMADDIPF
jgi:hypothetical protein